MILKLQILSLISYSLIILMGEIIGIPLLFWLVFKSFDLGSPEQIYAVLGIIGLTLNFTKHIKIKFVKIISFCLMIIPILSRLVKIPIEKFNYLSFQIPLLIFIILYIIIILKSVDNKASNKIQNE